MQNKPVFSVLVPTYNQAQYLGAALDSLLAQSYPNWEAIIVNDGSTDATVEVLDTYARKDTRFRVVHKTNGGAASALNVGLELAQGEWICWLSSDDLFEPRKLAIHVDWIRKHPECRFFFTLFRYLDEATGQLSDPPLWGKGNPERAWQVLEMLRCTYVHGNSICIHRDAWARVGKFNETLRYGQDYDMWLRLVASFPAIFIPERTCVTRVHSSQETHRFPEAGLFDSAKAAINFLNQRPFEQLVPLVDLNDAQAACRAVVKAIEIAANPKGFLYQLGPHPALIFRILEWVWNTGEQKTVKTMQHTIQKRAVKVSQQHGGTPFGFLWKVVTAASRLPQRRLEYETIVPAIIAESYYWQLRVIDSPEADKVRRYLETFENRRLPEEPLPKQGQAQDVVFVLQRGQSVSDTIKYGALRATIEVANYLRRAGRRIVLVGLSPHNLGFNEGVLCLGVPNDDLVGRTVQWLGQVDTLVGMSRADMLRMTLAQRYLIYHHNPYNIDGHIPVKVLNKHNIPVICVSRHSQAIQRAHGIRDDLVQVVYNGVNSEIFHVVAAQQRCEHSLVYVGNIIGYKGFDIALQAFAMIKRAYPEAMLHAYGRVVRRFQNQQVEYLKPDWLDQTGFPVWTAIEQDLPGFKYCGEVSQVELAKVLRQYALLVMPSRIPETFGMASIEAQACGCVPVLPNLGGFPETMREGITGYLYAPNTPERLAETISELWKHGLPTEAQRDTARHWVKETFSWEKTGASFLEIIESVSPDNRHVYFNYYPVLWQWEIVKTVGRHIARKIKKRRWRGIFSSCLFSKR